MFDHLRSLSRVLEPNRRPLLLRSRNLQPALHRNHNLRRPDQRKHPFDNGNEPYDLRNSMIDQGVISSF